MLTRNIFATILAATLATPLAAPVHAQAVGQGEVQLAESLGVEPGLYSLEQLSRLQGLENDDSTTAAQTREFILANPMGPAAMADTMARVGIGQGEVELAQSLNVEPGVYSLEQLSRLQGLANDDGTTAAQTREFILANPEGPLAIDVDVATTGTVGMGEEELAQILGVEPGLYSLEQLSRLHGLRNDDSETAAQTRQFILDNPEGPNAM